MNLVWVALLLSVDNGGFVESLRLQPAGVIEGDNNDEPVWSFASSSMLDPPVMYYITATTRATQSLPAGLHCNDHM